MQANSEKRGICGNLEEQTDTNLSCLLHPQKAGDSEHGEQREKGLIYKLSAA